MDNRLDFYQVLKEHLNTLTDDDSILVLAYNKKQGDFLISCDGDLEDISKVLCFPEENKDDFFGKDRNKADEVTKQILNFAYNICNNNKYYRDKMINGLRKLQIY